MIGEFIPKPKTCAYEKCGREFLPARPMQQVCGPVCAGRMVRARAAQKKAAERSSTRAQREGMKSLRQLLAEAQEAFNAYIRERDAGRRCIDCDQPFEPNKPGGSMDAGHFRARSVAPQLRFHEDNVFGQRKNCNRPGGTTYARFRAGVEGRIGLTRLLAVEADNTTHKWTKDEAREIRDRYRVKLKELIAARRAANE